MKHKGCCGEFFHWNIQEASPVEGERKRAEAREILI